MKKLLLLVTVFTLLGCNKDESFDQKSYDMNLLIGEWVIYQLQINQCYVDEDAEDGSNKVCELVSISREFNDCYSNTSIYFTSDGSVEVSEYEYNSDGSFCSETTDKGKWSMADDGKISFNINNITTLWGQVDHGGGLLHTFQETFNPDDGVLSRFVHKTYSN